MSWASPGLLPAAAEGFMPLPMPGDATGAACSCLPPGCSSLRTVQWGCIPWLLLSGGWCGLLLLHFQAATGVFHPLWISEWLPPRSALPGCPERGQQPHARLGTLAVTCPRVLTQPQLMMATPVWLWHPPGTQPGWELAGQQGSASCRNDPTSRKAPPGCRQLTRRSSVAQLEAAPCSHCQPRTRASPSLVPVAQGCPRG